MFGYEDKKQKLFEGVMFYARSLERSSYLIGRENGKLKVYSLSVDYRHALYGSHSVERDGEHIRLSEVTDRHLALTYGFKVHALDFDEKEELLRLERLEHERREEKVKEAEKQREAQERRQLELLKEKYESQS
jgi:hypothetical protein